MKISQAIAELQHIMDACGDLPIDGGCLHDETPLRKICVIDAHGCETDLADDARAIYLEA